MIADAGTITVVVAIIATLGSIATGAFAYVSSRHKDNSEGQHQDRQLSREEFESVTHEWQTLYQNAKTEAQTCAEALAIVRTDLAEERKARHAMQSEFERYRLTTARELASLRDEVAAMRGGHADG